MTTARHATLAGVLSDTHGNIPFMRRAAERLAAMGAEILFHLGDDEADVSTGLPLPVISVPGKFEPAYRSPSRRTLEYELAGWSVSAAHLPEDLPEGASIRLHGHTHHPRAEVSRLC